MQISFLSNISFLNLQSHDKGQKCLFLVACLSRTSIELGMMTEIFLANNKAVYQVLTVWLPPTL